MCAVTQGLAALIVCQVEELKSPEDTKLLEKSMQFLTEKCVEFCVKKINSNDLSYSEVMRKILKTYLGLLRDVKCLASDVFLSLPKVISPLTVMYLKKVSELNRQEEATDILQTLVSKTKYQYTLILTYVPYFLIPILDVHISFSAQGTQFYDSRIFCLFTFSVFFPDKSFKSISK